MRKWNRGPFACDSCGLPFEQLNGRQKLCEPVPGDHCQHCNFGHYFRPRCFTSLMDWLDDRAPIDFFGDYLQVIRETTNLNHLTLTKRPQNFVPRLKAVIEHYGKAPSANDAFCAWVENWLAGDSPANVWFGYTAGTKATWLKRYEIARNIPAAVLWCSAEPLLESLDFHDIVQDEAVPNSHMLDWIVIGGESGKNRREIPIEHITELAQQAQHCGCKVFVKQDTAFKSGQQGRIPDAIWAMKQFPK